MTSASTPFDQLQQALDHYLENIDQDPDLGSDLEQKTRSMDSILLTDDLVRRRREAQEAVDATIGQIQQAARHLHALMDSYSSTEGTLDAVLAEIIDHLNGPSS